MSDMKDGRVSRATIRAIVKGTHVSEDKITEKELAEAFKRMHYSSEVHAARLFDDIKKHREPEWTEGDLVRDALGRKWIYHNLGWDLVWHAPGSATSTLWPKPARPLTRYLPEDYRGWSKVNDGPWTYTPEVK